MFFRIHNQWVEYNTHSQRYNVENQLSKGFVLGPEPLNFQIVPPNGPGSTPNEQVVGEVIRRVTLRACAQSLRGTKWAVKHHLLTKAAFENGLAQEFSCFFLMPHFRNIHRAFLIYKRPLEGSSSTLATDEDLKPLVKGLGKMFKIGPKIYHLLFRELYKEVTKRLVIQNTKGWQGLGYILCQTSDSMGFSEELRRRLLHEAGEPMMTLCYPAKSQKEGKA